MGKAKFTAALTGVAIFYGVKLPKMSLNIYYTIKLDFPVGVTELIAFPPRPRDESDASGAED